MKPFDLQAAERGEPVCTRDGKKARIICFDNLGVLNNLPIIALVYSETLEAEFLYYYTYKGQRFEDIASSDDLMMLNDPEICADVYKFTNYDKLQCGLLKQILEELKQIEYAIWGNTLLNYKNNQI